MEKAKVAEPTEEDMMELLKYCSEMGCSLKQCQDQNILNRMISFISNSDCFTGFSSDEYDRSVCIKIFMEKVDAYLLSCCTLTDFGTVNCAIETVESEDKKEQEDLQKMRESRANRMVPTTAKPIVS
ncbi:hypothetical protein RchiOBHm_Chr7g0179571 [Rosa chinensis]|uniref:Uncharacterized protein n=1 Tax=Rosa chinensis TaxID=74649 RepID=A0A2P6P240_ROSCH|nr:hypothetical protein RchiOBHm_Chr7g0179571 [Rosa chinensis]